ncbi:hypothetical protein BLNAU_5025 [Blattamonas nauphoetae]|uniref:Uncharacterized protein n=1 Tax=Blattamonas nauphoetae TaxID=2049346 RepID=A0ABQ9Y8U3_9EUKA|nr:hypothetical protein BLNAU_5025 [Blattamonas nauphoetae]
MNSKLSFHGRSRIYCSLVALVKAGYPFDDALQDRTVRFLKTFEPRWGIDSDQASRLVTELVPSSTEPFSSFVESIFTLLSSPHWRVVTAALSFFNTAISYSSTTTQTYLVESDLVANLIAIVQPYSLSISRNKEIFNNLVQIINRDVYLALPRSLRKLRITAAVDAFNHREMILLKVVLPSTPFVTFLISNRYILSGNLLKSFMYLLDGFIDVGPCHRPTLDFVLASPIAMTFSSCLSFVEDENDLWNILMRIAQSMTGWKKESTEMVQSGKRMMQALFSEGFEDTLEQMMKHHMGRTYNLQFAKDCLQLSRLLGSNVKKP